jgi:hypothetical protein
VIFIPLTIIRVWVSHFKRALFRMVEQLWGPFEKFVDSPYYSFTFSRRVWSVVRNASLAKGGTSKKRSSLHFHKVLTQSINCIFCFYSMFCGTVCSVSVAMFYKCISWWRKTVSSVHCVFTTCSVCHMLVLTTNIEWLHSKKAEKNKVSVVLKVQLSCQGLHESDTWVAKWVWVL